MQTLISSAKRPKTSQEIATKIKSRVQPDIIQKSGLSFEQILAKEPVAPNNVNETKVTILLKASPKLPLSNVCRGVIADKDLSAEDFQEILKLYTEHHYDERARNDRKFVSKKVYKKLELNYYFSPTRKYVNVQ